MGGLLHHGHAHQNLCSPEMMDATARLSRAMVVLNSRSLTSHGREILAMAANVLQAWTGEHRATNKEAPKNSLGHRSRQSREMAERNNVVLLCEIQIPATLVCNFLIYSAV